MTRQSPPLMSPDFLQQGPNARNATIAETFPRWGTTFANTAIGATGVAHATAIALQAGDVVNNITFVTATTAAGTPTAGFIALYGPRHTAAGVAQDPPLLAQSADFGSTARAANTVYTIALASAVTITRAGLYYVSISFTASTVPTLHGVNMNNAVMSSAILSGGTTKAQTHGSALGATAPATITSGSAVATPCYYILN